MMETSIIAAVSLTLKQWKNFKVFHSVAQFANILYISANIKLNRATVQFGVDCSSAGKNSSGKVASNEGRNAPKHTHTYTHTESVLFLELNRIFMFFALVRLFHSLLLHWRAPHLPLRTPSRLPCECTTLSWNKGNVSTTKAGTCKSRTKKFQHDEFAKLSPFCSVFGSNLFPFLPLELIQVPEQKVFLYRNKIC